MSINAALQTKQEIVYPDSDGQPVADNTLQFEWIMTIKGNLDVIFRDAPQVFVAGDLLWYPVEGQPGIRRAPDAMVVFGRPKGYRGSYRQWEEQGLAPQVVFEVLSPGNTAREMREKFVFYDRYGVEEYYVYDPEQNEVCGWHRQGPALVTIAAMHGWVSPRLGVRFEQGPEELHLYRPNGQRFVTFDELDENLREAEAVITRIEQRATQAEEQAKQSAAQARQAEARAEQLAAQLRAMGYDPDALPGQGE
jgi:Uma2 family endonuclease